jgi:hypothetical protein
MSSLKLRDVCVGVEPEKGKTGILTLSLSLSIVDREYQLAGAGRFLDENNVIHRFQSFVGCVNEVVTKNPKGVEEICERQAQCFVYPHY